MGNESENDRASLASGPPEDAAELLAAMLAIRFFEDKTQELFARNLVRGSTHLYQGQEAVAVGATRSLVAGDTMVCTYRGHGATLAMGSPADRCFAELLGKPGGLCKGKGGSMHFTDVSVGNIGSNAIVGGQLPIAVGAALAAQYLETGAVSLAFMGDGSTNIGAFHEAVNLAAVWKLPAVFVIENNHYGEYSPLANTTPIERLVDRAVSYGIPGVYVDGNDVVSVRQVVTAAAARARDGGGPTLIEADTYRHSGHSRTDPAKYRPAGELDSWLERDPIKLLGDAMIKAGWVDLAGVEAAKVAARAEIDEALERAMSWPLAELDSRFEDVYA
jgi:acetoin:2,6-dichlorophenolindophenol oxidoreductase subunit alpha